jgi:hypothetical protein
VVNGSQQDVDLVAYGQDFVPIRQGIITTTTWTAEKPYLIFDYAFIDSLQTLTIEAGARIFLHDSAGISVAGTILAKGTPEKPIVFQGDRLEKLYEDVPDQWGGILIYPNTTQSVFENVVIKNGIVGIQIGHIFYEGGANVKLHNVKIEHMTLYGIWAVKSTIDATNTLIADCGKYCLLLTVGGSYDFTHCTIANFWGGYSTRTDPALVISNHASWDSQYFSGDLRKANFSNSIIWGDYKESEIAFGYDNTKALNFNFDHCLLKVNDSFDISNNSLFNAIITKADKPFYDQNKYIYMPDSLSPARNAGLPAYAKRIPYDIENISRLDDSAPDIGAYEYQYIEKKEEEE